MKNYVFYKKLEIFFTLCKYQSFSLVAKLLDIHQSRVSRNMQDLELFFENALLNNSHKPIVLSPFGEKLYKFCTEIFTSNDFVEKNLQDDQKLIEKVVIYFSIIMNLSYIFSTNLQKLLVILPEIQLDIDISNELTTELLIQKHFVISNKKFDNFFIANELIGSYKLHLAASAAYVKKYGYLKDLESLKRHKFIYVRNLDYEKFFPGITQYLNTKYVVENDLLAIECAKENCGITIVPSFMKNRFSDLIFFELKEKTFKIPIYFSYSKVHNNNYIEIILEYCRIILSEHL